ncbi:hypothetical protein P8452_52579 [Trifolium repens]|nr:hypothetical protein P8452_52579 [Trifolium repens]
MQVSYPKNAGDDDTMNFSPTAPNVCNEPVHDEAHVTEPLMTHGKVKEVTLADIMDVIKILNNRLDCMELCNKDVISCHIQELNNDAFRTPNNNLHDWPVDSSSGYSPEIALNEKM